MNEIFNIVSKQAIIAMWEHDKSELEKAKQIICDLLSKRPNITPADWVQARYFVGPHFRREWEQKPKALISEKQTPPGSDTGE